ncbi:DUF885 domain-containing protein [Halioglobus maricola]|nr:DUF885 domain-containing protein [Halioglobus maricola]
MYKIVKSMGLGLALVAAGAQADWLERSDAVTTEVMMAQGQHQPELMSYHGIAEFDTQVSQSSEQARQAQLATNRELIANLEGRLATEKHPKMRQDLQILIDALQRENVTSELYHDHLVPYENLPENLFRVFSILLDGRNDPARYPAALERLRKYNGEAKGYEAAASQAIAYATARMGIDGVVGPYVGEIDNHLQSADQLIAGIGSLLEEAGLQGWEDDYALLVKQLEGYNTWVDTELRKYAREDNRLPLVLYADNLKGFGVNAEPEELIARAQYSYQLLRSEMKAIAWRIAEKNDWKDKDLVSVILRMKQDQLSPEDVLPRYQQRLAIVEDIIRREDIVTLPRRPASIRVASEAESAAVPASFMKPPQLVGNTGQYGEFVLVTSNPALGEEARMDDFSHDAMTWALVVHEARPGHELQFARLIEDGTSLARASYAFNSANVEGWGLYAESIMQEFLPLEGQLFNLYTRIMRAARMFLDPMVNTGQISRDDARDFLMNQLALSKAMASSEADRYAFRAPGQATSYYWGYMGLSALRTEVELAQGDEFHQREFHDFILRQGLLPPEMLKKAVQEEFVR